MWTVFIWLLTLLNVKLNNVDAASGVPKMCTLTPIIYSCWPGKSIVQTRSVWWQCGPTSRTAFMLVTSPAWKSSQNTTHQCCASLPLETAHAALLSGYAHMRTVSFPIQDIVFADNCMLFCPFTASFYFYFLQPLVLWDTLALLKSWTPH